MPRPLRVDIRHDVACDIYFDVRLRAIARDLARRPLGGAHFVVTDANVAPLYGREFVARLRREHLPARLLTVPAGERSKSRRRKEELEDRMLAAGAHRDSVVVALGGGMVGDLAGFTAATLHRGVPLVQVPTSLIAQVDSSVGGKTAVDHPGGKNLIGAFHQPSRVYIDVAALSTLPSAEFRSGLAEVIKYGAIMDAALFALLEKRLGSVAARRADVMDRVVRRCCALKRTIVQADEREAGLRRLLNFGHTIGHAVELLANYRMRHGHAVAIGMCAEAWIGVALGITGRQSAVRLEELVRRYGLPSEIPAWCSPVELIRATRLDKKTLGGTVHYTMLRRIGSARPGIPLPAAELRSILAALPTIRKR